jgi:hypothetical protein
MINRCIAEEKYISSNSRGTHSAGSANQNPSGGSEATKIYHPMAIS